MIRLPQYLVEPQCIEGYVKMIVIQSDPSIFSRTATAGWVAKLIIDIHGRFSYTLHLEKEVLIKLLPCSLETLHISSINMHASFSPPFLGLTKLRKET